MSASLALTFDCTRMTFDCTYPRMDDTEIAIETNSPTYQAAKAAEGINTHGFTVINTVVGSSLVY